MNYKYEETQKVGAEYIHIKLHGDEAFFSTSIEDNKKVAEALEFYYNEYKQYLEVNNSILSETE